MTTCVHALAAGAATVGFLAACGVLLAVLALLKGQRVLAILVLAVAGGAVVAVLREGPESPESPPAETPEGAPEDIPPPPEDSPPGNPPPGDPPTEPPPPGKLTTSVAARGLERDDVEPIVDLVNTAAPNGAPRFVDRLSGFTVRSEGRALLLSGAFPRATVYRFDLTTRDGSFDMRRLYVPLGRIAYPDRRSPHVPHLERLLGRDEALTHTGPWDIVNGVWKVPTARVALDGDHVYTSWFDLPSLEDQRLGRVSASFALEIPEPGEHVVRISFDDFVRHTRWRPTERSTKRPPAETIPNPLRPGHVAAIAVGEDERVRALRDVLLRPERVGRHPRLPDVEAAAGPRLGPESAEVRKLIETLDPDRGELWEYSDDAESMGSGNDMDSGTKGLLACRTYDRLAARMTPEARQAVSVVFRKRFGGIYRYFVFQRNYNATGYAQNHSSKAVWALLAAGLVGDGPEAARWRSWAVMVCRKRVDLLGRDGGLESLNEGRDYGLRFWGTSREMIRHATGLDIATGPFFENEWRFALHNAPAFPTDRVPEILDAKARRAKGNLPLPEGVTPENVSTAHHFDDCDQVAMREDWSEDALRVRLTAGSVFGLEGTPRALRYNWAHCPVNRGSIAVWQGRHALVNEPGVGRTYRKSAGNNNCILVNDVDQWGGGQVYHPRLDTDQVGEIAFFADGRLMDVTRADLAGAYPPRAKVRALSRVLVHLAPDQFLVFDRLETEGRGKGEWRFHAPVVEPPRPASRYTVFAARKRGPRTHTTLDSAYARVPEVRAEVAFLWPAVRADVRMSDVAFRGSAFDRPMRHLRVVQVSEKPRGLLTAIAKRVRLRPDGRNVFVGRSGSVSWRVLVGPGKSGDLESDGHLTVLARDEESGMAEVFRFGGGSVRLDGSELPGGGPDRWVRLKGGEVESTVPVR